MKMFLDRKCIYKNSGEDIPEIEQGSRTKYAEMKTCLKEIDAWRGDNITPYSIIILLF